MRARPVVPCIVCGRGRKAVFHDIVVHDKSAADIRFLCIDDLKTEMPIHGKGVVIVFVAGEPDGRTAAFPA